MRELMLQWSFIELETEEKNRWNDEDNLTYDTSLNSMGLYEKVINNSPNCALLET